MKRQIRLREFEASKKIYRSPSVSYAQNSRGLSESISYKIQTDIDGYIVSGREFNAASRICIIGASLIENKFVKESSRWNTYLEKIFLRNSKPVKVLNAGYSGATSLNVLNSLLNKLCRGSFDLIIYFISSNDYSAISYEDSYWNLTKDHSNFFLDEYNFADRNYKKKSIEDFESVIKSIYAVASNFNQNFYFSTYPNISNESSLVFLNQMLREVCNKNNYNLFDIDFIMKSLDIAFEDNFYDRRHFNDQGSELFSQLLFNFFSDKILVGNTDFIYQETQLLNEDIDFNLINQPVFFNNFLVNRVHRNVSLYFVFNIDNLRSSQNETFLVKIHFERLNSVRHVDNIKYSDELGWYFYISVPKGKTLENSHFFEVSFIGEISISIENRLESPKAIINSISLETMYY